MSDVAIAIIGRGRMGEAVATLAPERGCRVVATLGRAEVAAGGITTRSLGGADVAIEFTTPDAAADNALACVAAGCPVVVGTTGWRAALPRVAAGVAAADGALLHAPNFSTGVVLFAEAVRGAAAALRSAGFDAHLVETHHTAKRDAPSGTAVMLSDAAGGVATTSVRVGHVPGTHELIFDAPFEQVRLVHEARDRRVFADGALRAARWLVGRRGMFTMRDVLALPPLPETP